MTQSPAEAPNTELRCARHPQVATNLRCGKCDTPICPQCLVHTPVGARCPDCAQLRSLPQFQVKPLEYLKAVGAAAGVAVGAGIIWAVIPFGGFLGFFISGGVGYVLGNAINRATNWRRSRGLQTIAVLGMVLAFLVMRATTVMLAFGAVSPALMPFAFSAAFGALMNPITLVMIGIGSIVAVSRIG